MFKYVLALTLFTNMTYAGYISPEIKGNNVTVNDSPLGSVWQDRKSYQISIIKTTLENNTDGSKTSETATTGVTLSGTKMAKKYTAEGFLNYAKGDITPTSGTASTIRVFNPDFKLGYRLTDNYGFGLGYFKNSSKVVPSSGLGTTTRTTTMTAGGSAKFDNILTGIGYKSSEDSTDIELGGLIAPTVSTLPYSSIFLGIGYQDYDLKTKEGYGGELVIEKRSSAESGSLSKNARTDIIASFTWTTSLWIELDFEINKASEESHDGATEIDILDLNLRTELFITEEFYIAPGYEIRSKETTTSSLVTTEDETVIVGNLGYRQKDYSIELGIQMLTTDTTTSPASTVKEDNTTVMNLSAFFNY